jgi:anti-sigma-K factor RskA
MIMKSKVKKLETVQAEEPKLVVELALQEWEAVLAVIENSTSPHIQVKSVSAELVKQLQPQVKTTEEK